MIYDFGMRKPSLRCGKEEGLVLGIGEGNSYNTNRGICVMNNRCGFG
jgi:hypothetical protein